MLAQFRTFAAIGFLSFLLVACGGSGSSSSGGGGDANANGRWRTSFNIPGASCTGIGGTVSSVTILLDLALSQNGSAVSGTYRAQAATCTDTPDATGSITGSTSGSSVTLTDDDGARYNLTFRNIGPSMAGTVVDSGVTIRINFVRP